MIGVDPGNYNLIVARQAGNETTTLQDATGLRQVPATVLRDAEQGRLYRTRGARAEGDFLRRLETAGTADEQFRQLCNLDALAAFADAQFTLNGQPVVCALPAHLREQSRWLVAAVLRRRFRAVRVVPQHLAVAAQYFFRRHADLTAAPAKMGFLQVNEFDTVYSSFLLTRDAARECQHRVLPLGSRDVDALLYAMCREQRRELPPELPERHLEELKRAKRALSLGQAAAVQFPEFDVRIEAAAFRERFRPLQARVRALLEPDLAGLELLGGGARLLDRVRADFAPVLTRRLNPDEAAAQGAVCLHLLAAAGRLRAERRHAGEALLLDGAAVLRAGDALPLERRVPLARGAAEARLHLAGGFVLLAYRLSWPAGGRAACVVRVDACGEPALAFEGCGAELAFDCREDPGLWGRLRADEERWRAVEEAHARRLAQGAARGE